MTNSWNTANKKTPMNASASCVAFVITHPSNNTVTHAGGPPAEPVGKPFRIIIMPPSAQYSFADGDGPIGIGIGIGIAIGVGPMSIGVGAIGMTMGVGTISIGVGGGVIAEAVGGDRDRREV
jgi:hypothetical protein